MSHCDLKEKVKYYRAATLEVFLHSNRFIHRFVYPGFGRLPSIWHAGLGAVASAGCGFLSAALTAMGFGWDGMQGGLAQCL